jgi:ATP-binding cassette subfamily B (MDR/TAP) protein 1
MLSSIPLIVLSGAMTSMVIAKATSTGQEAYSKSASVVEQTISSIRTVSTLAKKITLAFCFIMLLQSI